MSEIDTDPIDGSSPKKIHSQLLNLHERILTRLNQCREDLNAPTTQHMVRRLRQETGGPAGLQVARVVEAVEGALRSVQVCQSELQKELVDTPEPHSVEGIANLPASLARFLAERSESPRFEYDVLQDPIRGWVIRWKEYTENGSVRGRGQFYERPYAWLDD